MCLCTLQLRVADAVRSRHDHVRHFIPIQFVLSWLGGVPFEMACCRAYTCASWRLACK